MVSRDQERGAEAVSGRSRTLNATREGDLHMGVPILCSDEKTCPRRTLRHEYTPPCALSGTWISTWYSGSCSVGCASKVAA